MILWWRCGKANHANPFWRGSCRACFVDWYVADSARTVTISVGGGWGGMSRHEQASAIERAMRMGQREPEDAN